MDEIMIEAQITRPEEDISDNIEKVEAAFSHAEAAIKESKANRENENVFDGYMLENAKANLEAVGMQNSNLYFRVLLERLFCDWKVIPRTINDKDEFAQLYDYSYDSLESLENSKAYKSLCEMEELFPDEFSMVENNFISPVREYYNVRSDEVGQDIVVLYDNKYKTQAEQLCSHFREYTVQTFNISSYRSYSDPELLSALHTSTLMVFFCESLKEGERALRIKQFKNSNSNNKKALLLVTEHPIDNGDGLPVSMADGDWKEQIAEKAAILINGAPPKAKLVEELIKREETLIRIVESRTKAIKEIDRFEEELEKQIVAIENYVTLYGERVPCKYDTQGLEDLYDQFSEEAEHTKDNVYRWLGKMKRDNKIIKSIINDQRPSRFFERYEKLCKLIEEQKEHREKLLQHISLDELKKKLGDVISDRSELNKIRREYQQALKKTILEKYMIPFDRVFYDCVAINAIKIDRIENYIENFENLEKHDILLSSDDGLHYWTKRAFKDALREKRYLQGIIDSQIERMEELSKDTESMLGRYELETFNPYELRKQAERLIGLIKDFRKEWGFHFEKDHIIYRGKMCFAKYTDEKELNDAVEKAIRKHDEAMKQAKLEKSGAIVNFNSASDYKKLYDDTGDYAKRKMRIELANSNYKSAADLGHPEAQYRYARHAEKGVGMEENMSLALEYYKKAADNNHHKAQLRLGKYYLDKNDKSEALKWYEKAAEAKNIDACLWMGDYYKSANDTEKAVAYYRRAASNKKAEERMPDIPAEKRRTIGAMFYNEKDYKTAIKWLEGLNDEMVRVGDCYFYLLDTENAVAAYRRVPMVNLSEARKKYLANNLREKEPMEALRYYEHCERVDSDIQILNYMADCYVSSKDYEKAALTYEKVLKIKDDAELGKKTEELFWKAENYEKTLEYIHKYFEPMEDKEISYRAAECYLHLGKSSEAVSFYLNCYETISNSDKLFEIAGLFLDNEMTEPAKKCYDRLLELCDEALPLSYRRAIADFYFGNGREESSLDLYIGVYNATNDADIAKRIADVFSKNGINDRAAEWYEIYAEKTDDKEVAETLAYYYLNCDENEKAAKWLESCRLSVENDKKAVVFMINYYANNASHKVDCSFWCMALEKLAIRNSDISELVDAFEKCERDLLKGLVLKKVGDFYYHHSNVSKAADWWRSYVLSDRAYTFAKESADKLWYENHIDEAACLYEIYAENIKSVTVSKLLGNYYKERNPQKALDWYKKNLDFSQKTDEETIRAIIDLEVEYNPSKLNYGWYKKLGDILLSKRDTEGACDAYKAYSKGIFDPTVVRWLADHYFEKEDWISALSYYTMFCKRTFRYEYSIVSRIVDIYEYIEKLSLPKIELNDRYFWIEKLGNILHESGDVARAVVEYEKCNKKECDSLTQKRAGDYYFAKDDLDEALSWYRKMSGYYRDLELMKRIGDRYFEKNEPDNAIEYYERCCRIAEGRSSNTITVDEQQSYEKVLNCLISLYGKTGDAKNKCGVSKKYADILWKSGKYGLAAELYDAAGTTTFPSDYNEKLGVFYLTQDDKKKAKDCFDKCLDGNDFMLARRIGDAYYRYGDKDSAYDWYVRGWNIKKDSHLAKCIGDIYFYKGDVSTAEQWYDKYLLNNKDDSLVYRFGEYCLDNGKEKEGIEWYNKYLVTTRAYFVDAEFIKRLCNIGKKFYENNRISEALKCYSMIEKYDPTVSFNIAECYYFSGEYDKAREVLSGCSINRGQSGVSIVRPRCKVVYVKGDIFVAHSNHLHKIEKNAIKKLVIKPSLFSKKVSAILYLNENAPKNLPKVIKLFSGVSKNDDLVHALDPMCERRKKASNKSRRASTKSVKLTTLEKKAEKNMIVIGLVGIVVAAYYCFGATIHSILAWPLIVGIPFIVNAIIAKISAKYSGVAIGVLKGTFVAQHVVLFARPIMTALEDLLVWGDLEGVTELFNVRRLISVAICYLVCSGLVCKLILGYSTIGSPKGLIRKEKLSYYEFGKARVAKGLFEIAAIAVSGIYVAFYNAFIEHTDGFFRWLLIGMIPFIASSVIAKSKCKDVEFAAVITWVTLAVQYVCNILLQGWIWLDPNDGGFFVGEFLWAGVISPIIYAFICGIIFYVIMKFPTKNKIK